MTPTDTQMLDWMIATAAHVLVASDGTCYVQWYDVHGEEHQTDTHDTPRAAIAAAMQEDKG